MFRVTCFSSHLVWFVISSCTFSRCSPLPLPEWSATLQIKSHWSSTSLVLYQNTSKFQPRRRRHSRKTRSEYRTSRSLLNKCIGFGDDTKAAARQSLNCIKNKKNKIWRKTIFNNIMADRILTPCNVARSRRWFRQVTAPCSVACGSGIVTVNSPSGSTLQCDTWLLDDMPLNSPKRPPYWNSTSGFHFHTSPQSTCHYVPVCEILSKLDQP